MQGVVEHSGTVVRVERDRLFVRIEATGACGACRAREACGMGEARERIVEALLPEAASYAAGDEVTVGVRRSVGLRAVVVAYVGALAVLLAALVLGVSVLHWEERAAALASLGAVALYYGALRLLHRRIGRSVRFVVTRKTE